MGPVSKASGSRLCLIESRETPMALLSCNKMIEPVMWNCVTSTIAPGRMLVIGQDASCLLEWYNFQDHFTINLYSVIKVCS